MSKKVLCWIGLCLSLFLTSCSAGRMAGCGDTDIFRERYESQSEEVAASEGSAGFSVLSDNEESEDVENGTADAEDALLSHIPEWSGDPYFVINGNIPFFTEEERQSTSEFMLLSAKDALGRCGGNFMAVSPDSMPTETRGEIGMVKPSGWQTVRYDDLINGKYLFNRCHLLGFQLSGLNADDRNLITGTRYMNVDGQLPFENAVAQYVEDTGNHVLYRVTPIYKGDNLVASGVLEEAWSVEDRGAGVRFCVFCYNIQPGVEINYLTGDSARSPDAEEDVSIALGCGATSVAGGVDPFAP